MRMHPLEREAMCERDGDKSEAGDRERERERDWRVLYQESMLERSIPIPFHPNTLDNNVSLHLIAVVMGIVFDGHRVLLYVSDAFCALCDALVWQSPCKTNIATNLVRDR